MHQGSFWKVQNAWWKEVTPKMACGEASETDWVQADERLRNLSWKVPEAVGISTEDRQDLVQVILLRLQEKSLCLRLAEIDTPAHYLARVMKNFLLDKIDHDIAMHKMFLRYAGVGQTPKDNRPDALAAGNDLKACARYVVNHEVSRKDRAALWGWARGDTIQEIARALGCSAGNASVILFRAKKKFEEVFRRKFSR